MLNHRWVQQINTCSAGEAQIFNFELFMLADIAAAQLICGTKIFSLVLGMGKSFAGMEKWAFAL